MAYTTKKLSEVESLAEVPENATVLAEVDGVIKRIPGDELGGKTIFINVTKTGYDGADGYENVVNTPDKEYKYEDVKNFIISGAQVVLRIHDTCEMWDGSYHNDYYFMYPSYVIDNGSIAFQYLWSNKKSGSVTSLWPDNTWIFN